MPEDILPDPPEGGEGLEEEEHGDELCSMLQILFHFHVEDGDGAGAERLHGFMNTALEKVNSLLEELVEETPGIVHAPENPRRYGITPEEMELSEEDIAKLLNPEGPLQ